MTFPSLIQYSIVDWGYFKLKVVANSIRASNIEMDVHDIVVNFLPDQSDLYVN